MTPVSSQTDLLARLLDVSQLRHQVIAQNVANVNTPGYQRREVRFEEAFTRAVAAATGRPLDVAPQVALAEGGTTRRDGNNVDIDQEMGDLNKNTLLSKVYTQVLALQLSQMRSAISGR